MVAITTEDIQKGRSDFVVLSLCFVTCLVWFGAEHTCTHLYEPCVAACGKWLALVA